MVKNPIIRSHDLDLWPITLIFSAFCAVVKGHVHAKFHQVACSGSWVIVRSQKKNRMKTIRSFRCRADSNNIFQNAFGQIHTEKNFRANFLSTASDDTWAHFIADDVNEVQRWWQQRPVVELLSQLHKQTFVVRLAIFIHVRDQVTVQQTLEAVLNNGMCCPCAQSRKQFTFAYENNSLHFFYSYFIVFIFYLF